LPGTIFQTEAFFLFFTANITGSKMSFGKGESSWDVSSGCAWKMLWVRTGKALFLLLKCDLPEGVRTKHRHDATGVYLSSATHSSAGSRGVMPTTRGPFKRHCGKQSSTESLSVWSLIMDRSHVRHTSGTPACPLSQTASFLTVANTFSEILFFPPKSTRNSKIAGAHYPCDNASM